MASTTGDEGKEGDDGSHTALRRSSEDGSIASSVGAQPHTSSAPQSRWLPLPHLLSGVCIFPFHPDPPPSATSTVHSPLAAQQAQAQPAKSASSSRNRFSWSGFSGAGPSTGPGTSVGVSGKDARGHCAAGRPRQGGDDSAQRNGHEVPLDLGDEFFAFESYDEPHTGLWYRGYVMPAPTLKSLAPSTSSSHTQPVGADIAQDTYPRPEAVVLIGIFPAAAVSVRPGGVDENPALQAAYDEAVRVAHQARDRQGSLVSNGHGAQVGMEAVQEEDETDSPPRERGDVEADTTQGTRRYVSIPRTPSPNSPQRKRGSSGSGSTYVKQGDTPGVIEGLLHMHNREESGDALRTPPGQIKREERPPPLGLPDTSLSKRRDDGRRKEEAPLPRLTAGDSTLAGQGMPIVDEIACAVREWYARLPTYLAHREYRLFSTVSQHIDALLLGRRQLLSQTLSDAELARVKRECVSRLVKCNVAQGLEVIVRSLEDGSVIVVDRDRATTDLSRVGTITAYIFQVQLAYIDLIPLGTLFGGKLPSVSPASQRLSLPAAGIPPTPSPGSYYQFCLDIRAFVASPCSPGETAELYFSLYNKAEGQFISEEYLLVLNHLGSPARDAEQRLGRLRTLFTQIKQEDLKGGLYVVCRLIRNGAFKMRSEPGSAIDTVRRTSIRPTGSHLGSSSMSLASRAATIRGQASTSALSAVSEVSWSDGASTGFGGNRTQTNDTRGTVTQSIVDGRPTFRRPLGVAVLELPQLAKMMADGSEKGAMEFSMPIFAPREEGSFAGLHAEIIDGKMGSTTANPRAESIAVAVRMLHGDAASLVREHPPLLADVPFTRRLNFPDVVHPGVERHDLYVKLWSAQLSATTPASSSLRLRQTGSSGTAVNVQITFELRKSDGSYIHNALFSGGSGEPSMQQWHSICYAQMDNPTYGELVRIQLPREALRTASPSSSSSTSDVHLFVTFRSRGRESDRSGQDHSELERPFAFAYLPLWGTDTIKDGMHDLSLVRWDGPETPSPRNYLEPTRGTEDRASTANMSMRDMGLIKDKVTIRTSLVSTSLSQDDTLSELFDWQTLLDHPEPLTDVLRRFAFTDECEISKFLPRVLDALFGVLTSGGTDTHDAIRPLVFSALVKVLLMSTDRRFPNFGPVLELYISRQYTWASASSYLLDMMSLTMKSANTTEYRSFLKIWHLFFRFIIRSREMDRSRGFGLDATSAHIEASFQERLQGVLQEINRLMRRSEDSLIGTKTLAVQHYADLLPSLAHVFPPVELAEMVIAFTDTLTHVKGNLAIYKLLLVLQVVKEIFDAADARALLIPAIVRWVKPHLGKYMYDEAMLPDWKVRAGEGMKGDTKGKDARKGKWLECSRLAVTVVAWTVNRLEEWLESPAIREEPSLLTQERDNFEYCLELLPALCETYTEHNSASTQATLARLRTEGTTWKDIPDVFPSSHPFSLIASLPPPSLISQSRQASEGGVPDVGIFYPCRAECAVVILSLLHSVPRENLDNYLVEMLDILGRASTSARLGLVISFAQSVVEGEAFPENWMTVNLISLFGVIRVLHAIGDLLQKDEFLPAAAQESAEGQGDTESQLGDDRSLDVPLWRSVFALLCDYCASSQLALEDHTTQRRRAGWIIVGDLRDEGATLLLKLWNMLGESSVSNYQSNFLSLADRVLSLCMSSHDQLCEMAVEILFSMMLAEHEASGKFSQVESQIFDQLDGLFTPKSEMDSSESTMRAYFITQLRTLFTSKMTLPFTFSEAFTHFLEQVESFIGLLLQLRELPDSPQWADERADAIFQLMDFVQRQGRTELYARFAGQLVDIHVQQGDEVSAGFATHLQALAYEWDEDAAKTVSALPTSGQIVGAGGKRGKAQEYSLPSQTQWARKESLYLLAIDRFTDGEAYELALDLCHELVTKHREVTYDLKKLVELHSQQAALWTRIGESVRMKPEYYRVVFMLRSGTVIDRSKDFIVRSSRGKEISTFLEQIEDRFPEAELYRLKIPPAPRLVERGDLIWVYPVVPEVDPARLHPANREGVHPHLQEWYRNNGLNRFISTRPFKKDMTAPLPPDALDGDREREKAVEGIMMWLEKTVLTTREALPCALARSEVVGITYEQISPVAHAASEVRRAMKSLKALYSPRSGTMIDVKMLGTAINGAVSSPVSGGVPLYRDTFLAHSFGISHPELSSEIRDLQEVLEDYCACVIQALRVHGKLCKDIAYHEALKSHFRRSFPDEAHALSRVSESTSDRHTTLGQPLSPMSSASSPPSPQRPGVGMPNSQSFSALSAVSHTTSGSKLTSMLKPSQSSPTKPSSADPAGLNVAINTRRHSQLSDTSRTSDGDSTRNRVSRLFPSFRQQGHGRNGNGDTHGNGSLGHAHEDAEDSRSSIGGAATPTPGIRVDDYGRASFDADTGASRGRPSLDGQASTRTGATGISAISGTSSTGAGSGIKASGSGGHLGRLFGGVGRASGEGSRTPSVRSGDSLRASPNHVRDQNVQGRGVETGARSSPLPSPTSGLSDFGYLAPALNGDSISQPSQSQRSEAGSASVSSHGPVAGAGGLQVPAQEGAYGRASIGRKGGMMKRFSSIMRRDGR